MHKKLTETLSQYKKIILVGGGTGGHIQPILSLVKNLDGEHIFKKTDFIWIGGSNSSEQVSAKGVGITFHTIPTLKLSTTRSPKILLYPFRLLEGIWKARAILKNEKRKTKNEICIFSKGGPGSLAVGIAAYSLEISIYIHESDTIPGRSNQLLGRFAQKVFLGFESAKKYFQVKKCEVVGQILDPVFSIQQSNSPTVQQSTSWKTQKPHILVICGSQGARSVFQAILTQFSDDHRYEWIISLGKLNSGMKKDFENREDIQALEWISQENIASLLLETDLAITRGSATTLAEIDAFGVRKIIIPLPSAAKNHQYWNAKEYQKNEDILLEQKDINDIFTLITKYFSDAKNGRRKKTR